MIKLIKRLAWSVVIWGFAVHVFASEPSVIGWDDLAPEPLEYDNPFSQLNTDQLSGLKKLLRFELSKGGGSEIMTVEEAAALRAELEADGLDVDWLFEQRRIIMETRHKIATATNDKLLGQSVRIPGYLLPLEIKDQKAVEFLLVPTVGACIHTPPPPANQMVHVRYPDGFSIDGLYTPIWVSGRLLAKRNVETVRYADGESRVELSYAMTADTVEPY
jgi:uncharacterized protein